MGSSTPHLRSVIWAMRICSAVGCKQTKVNFYVKTPKNHHHHLHSFRTPIRRPLTLICFSFSVLMCSFLLLLVLELFVSGVAAACAGLVEFFKRPPPPPPAFACCVLIIFYIQRSVFTKKCCNWKRENGLGIERFCYYVVNKKNCKCNLRNFWPREHLSTFSLCNLIFIELIFRSRPQSSINKCTN